MKLHYNLYYLFLEDKMRNPMAALRAEEIRKAVERFYKTLVGMKKQRLLPEQPKERQEENHPPEPGG